MSVDGRVSLNDQISEEAAEWLVAFRSGDVDAADQRGFDAWLRASPEHIRAFIEMAALWHEGGGIDARRELDIEAIIARARSEQRIAELPPAPGAGAADTVTRDPGGGSGRGRWRRSAGWAMAAGLSVAGLATMLILRSAIPGPQTYVTGVGETRSIALPDGSKVLLDSKSRLRVAYTAAVRHVELAQGQALFDVVRNPRRPFLVAAGDALVRDLGTVFDVNRLGRGTVVTVVEGRVAIPTPLQPIYLSAGEQVELDLGHFSPRPIHVDISSQTAWTHGEVVLDSATLSEVAQLFNHYSTRKLVAQDRGAKPLRLSGVFSTNPNFIMRYLRSRPDVAVTETGSEIDIVRSSAP
jgi:transmembrane sensor